MRKPTSKPANKKTPRKKAPRRRAPRTTSQTQRVNVNVKTLVGAQEAPPPPMVPFEKGWNTYAPITYQMPPLPMEPREVPVVRGESLGMTVNGHTLGGSVERSRLVRGSMADVGVIAKPMMADMGTAPDPVMSMTRAEARDMLRERGLPVSGTTTELRIRLMKAINESL